MDHGASEMRRAESLEGTGDPDGGRNKTEVKDKARKGNLTQLKS